MNGDAGFLAARTSHFMHVPRLSAVQEAELVQLWTFNRDQDARRRLIEANMRHVVAIARKYRRYPVPFEDMLAEGAMGLLVALDRFDPEKGVRLVTYASYWIRAYIFQAIIREWRRGKTGLGMTRSKTFFRIRRIRASYGARFGDDERHMEGMARELEVSPESLREMLDHIETSDVSMDSDRTGDVDGWSGLHERLASSDPDPEMETASSQDRLRVRAAVSRAMQVLDERERLVATARLMEEDPRTLAELGRRMGVSRERARQIETRALEKLGRALVREGLASNRRPYALVY